MQPETFSLHQKFIKEKESKLNEEREKHQQMVEKNKEQARIQTLKIIQSYKAESETVQKKIKLAESNGGIYVPAEPHFFFVMRVRGMNRVPPKERKTLDLLRLRRVNTGVFLINNKSTKQMLQLVRNYVAYGYITLEVMRELIYKRGLRAEQYKDKDSKGLNITNEDIIKKFGDLCCIEDLVKCLWTNVRFVEVNRFLAPFRLNSPTGGFKGRKARDFLMGGSCGNHYEMLGELITRMID